MIDHRVRAQAEPALVADARAARDALGWMRAFPDLDTIVAHAWVSEQKRVG